MSAQSRVTEIATTPRASSATSLASVVPFAGAGAQAGVSPISTFIDLEVEARGCASLDQLRYAIVNSTRRIADFDQAFLAEPDAAGSWSVSLASSVVKIDRHTQIIRGLDSWLRHPQHAPLIERGEFRMASLEQEALLWGLQAKIFHFPHALWLPLKNRDGRALAALLALKSENWRSQQTALLLPLADAYGHAWDALAPRTATPLQRARRLAASSRLLLGAGLAVLGAAFIPVPMSALAPAEVVATDPALVSAPIDGVIADILLPPGAQVEVGTPIIRFVDVKLRNEAEVAARNKDLAQARHFKVLQSATANAKDMQDLASTKADLDVATAELDYAMELLARTEVRAERSGLLIYAAKSDWIGKPVALGERIMEIGDPQRSEIRIDLPVSDAIALKQGGPVSLYLDGNPLDAVGAMIARTSYRPTPTADQQLAFRLAATFNDGQARRIGLRGVARVSGDSVQLWFYLLRRPIAALRQRMGL